MKPSRNLFLLVAILIVPIYSFAQGGVNNIWYFGAYAGLDFSSGSPVAITNGAMTSNEGCTSICDANGNLLFYSDGITVWNANHVAMTNSLATSPGGVLGGDPSSTQSAIIVPMPLHPNFYFIFTTDANIGTNGCRYSVVKMNAVGGANVILVNKNTLLFTPSAEKITAVKHANNVDYWVIAHPWNSGNFNVYLVHQNGVSLTPVISSVGAVYSGGSDLSRGYLKASPNGEMIAAAIEGLDKYELFYFNKSTGQVSFYFATPQNYQAAYGVEFSPNGTILYGSERWGTPIFQWNLEAGTPAQIMASQNHIATLSSAYGGALQLAPDMKIYLARNSQQYLGVIENPNLLGVASAYLEPGVLLGTKTSREGLPNLITSLMIYPDFVFEDACFGDTCYFQAFNSTYVDSLLWNFDEPNSGNANSDTVLQTYHLFSAPGTYNVQLFFFSDGIADTITHPVEITAIPFVSLGNDTNICDGEIISLDAITNVENLHWSTGDTTTTIDVYTQGMYSVSVSNTCGEASDSISVSVIPLPYVNLGPDTISSPIGVPIVLSANVTGDNLLWSTGATTDSITLMNAGTYHLTVTENGCSGSDSVYIYFYIGIEEESTNDNFSIFPNPATNRLNIISNERIEKIKIYSVNGKLVQVIEKKDISTQINIEGLSEGIYFLKSEYSSGLTHTKKFSVIR